MEKVPIGTPVTWCHRMVVCAKKNGSLQRTIDFQSLNQHTTRETHHTQSPFHQARSIPGDTSVERIPLGPVTRRRSSLHLVHHTMGKVPILYSSPRLHPQETGTQADTMESSPTSTRRSAAMTRCFGPTYRKPISRQWNGWTSAAQTE